MLDYYGGSRVAVFYHQLSLIKARSVAWRDYGRILEKYNMVSGILSWPQVYTGSNAGIFNIYKGEKSRGRVEDTKYL